MRHSIYPSLEVVSPQSQYIPVTPKKLELQKMRKEKKRGNTLPLPKIRSEAMLLLFKLAHILYKSLLMGLRWPGLAGDNINVRYADM